jgi:hypothetical protein
MAVAEIRASSPLLDAVRAEQVRLLFAGGAGTVFRLFAPRAGAKAAAPARGRRRASARAAA